MDEKLLANYTVRRLTPADAPAIPDLTERVNGPGYIHSEVYHPERLLKLNETGQLVSMVALYAGHEVVGHTALERPDLGPIAETGEAMVLPEHQHHHLLDRMKEALEEEARKLGLAATFGNAVTHHVFSQRTEERFKAHPISLLLAASPAQAHRIEGTHPQRVSLLSYFKYLCEPGGTVAHLPEHHRPMVSRIYELIGRQVRFGTPAEPIGPVILSTSYDPATQKGLIKVLEPGSDTAEQIDKARHGLLNNMGADVIYLELPLERTASGRVCAQAEQLGFFFSGISPQAPDCGDWLRLQFQKVPIDLSALQIESEFARQMLAYIDGERSRVRR
ncbi:MAG: GNAT family N-acetyltransferase [Candidatus Binataceae bacterium]